MHMPVLFLMKFYLKWKNKKQVMAVQFIYQKMEDRAIGGSSSGAVCAFTAAWEHPEEFSRVFSAIGTYIGLRGADRYPTLIRKYEPKPSDIFTGWHQ